MFVERESSRELVFQEHMSTELLCMLFPTWSSTHVQQASAVAHAFRLPSDVESL